ncbi:MAG: hypothetical protein ACRD8O_07810 [Bryobacteraceae bacterium]
MLRSMIQASVVAILSWQFAIAFPSGKPAGPGLNGWAGEGRLDALRPSYKENRQHSRPGRPPPCHLKHSVQSPATVDHSFASSQRAGDQDWARPELRHCAVSQLAAGEVRDVLEQPFRLP